MYLATDVDFMPAFNHVLSLEGDHQQPVLLSGVFRAPHGDFFQLLPFQKHQPWKIFLLAWCYSTSGCVACWALHAGVSPSVPLELAWQQCDARIAGLLSKTAQASNAVRALGSTIHWLAQAFWVHRL
jgi:hypothetical protein